MNKVSKDSALFIANLLDSTMKNFQDLICSLAEKEIKNQTELECNIEILLHFLIGFNSFSIQMIKEYCGKLDLDININNLVKEMEKEILELIERRKIFKDFEGLTDLGFIKQ